MNKKTVLTAALLTIATCVAAQNADGTATTAAGAEAEAVEFPESMGFELDSLMNLYMAKTYLDNDENCKSTDSNPTFDKEVYVDRLSRIPSVIEMPYNEVVRKFIDRYSGQLRHSVSYMLGASNFYMPIFEEALEAYGLPLELRYLPVIESALNPNAVSHAGATGLWQFMLATGKNYGLTVSSLVDERRDPVKSSYAAAHYLSDLYKVYGDWTLAIAAYNCGPEQVNKAIHRSNGKRDYWELYPWLPKETRGYVPAFIAANYIMTYYCDHGICPMTTRLPDKTDTLMLSRDVHLEQVSAVCSIDIEQLRALNPAYRNDMVPGSSTLACLRLPLTHVGRFIDNEDSVYNYRADELLHKRTEVAVKTTTPATTGKSQSASSGAKYITIRSGMTLGSIAKTYGTTVSKLKKLNGLKSSAIRAGRKLRVR